MIVDLFLAALQGTARHGSRGLQVDIQIPLGEKRLVQDLVGPLDIGVNGYREAKRQDACGGRNNRSSH